MSERGELPYEWAELSSQEAKDIRQRFPGPVLNDLVRFPELDVVMPRTYVDMADRVYNFPLRDNDVWVNSFPKCGTTWTQEMVWMIINNVDKERCQESLETRSPFLEVGCIWPPEFVETLEEPNLPEHLKEKILKNMDEFMRDPIEYTKNLGGRRVIKTHLQLKLLPPHLLDRCKVIYVARNSKDAAVSFYNHNVKMPGHEYQGSFADYLRLYREGLQLYGSYWAHLRAAVTSRHPNIKTIWFEDMKKDLRSEKKLCELLEHLSFAKMKDNPAVDPSYNMVDNFKFFRKGSVGDWKAHFTEEMLHTWDSWIQENRKGIEVKFE